MAYDIVLGRSRKEYLRLGTDAAALLGKHYVTMGKTTSLANNIFMDVNSSHVVLIAGKRGSGKCLHGDSLITLSNGTVKKISELEKDENNVFGLNDDLKVKKLLKQGFYKRKVDKLLHIKLRSGKEIKLTSEHPLLTIKGWLKTEELNIGSRIATPRKISNFGNKEMEDYKIKLLAYLIAEGHLSNGFVLFSNFDDEIVADFKKCVKLFDTNLQIKIHSKPGYFRVSQTKIKYKFNEKMCLRNKKGGFVKSGTKPAKSSLTNWLIGHGTYNKLSLEKIIPTCIFKLPKFQLALFLNRLFSCDGSIYKHKTRHGTSWEISYSSSSEELIHQVQHLLLRFSILSRLRKKKIKCNNKEFTTYELVINRVNLLKFIEEIGFYGNKKRLQKEATNESVDIISNPNVDTIPKEIWDNYRPNNWAGVGKDFNYKNPKSLHSSINYSPSRQKLAQIAMSDSNEAIYLLATSDIFWDEIVEINELKGVFTVYDISVPQCHNFIANDIIVHNSYTMGVMAEAMMNLSKDVKKNIGMIFFDTMGLYWTTKYPNYKQNKLLAKWKLTPTGFENDVVVYVPSGYYDYYKERGVPVDKPFTVNPTDVGAAEWCTLFNIELSNEVGVCIESNINKLKKKQKQFNIDDIKKTISKDDVTEKRIKNAAINRFENAETWGLFSEKATPLTEIIQGGKMSVIDISIYASATGGFDIRGMVIGLVCRRLLERRMVVRKIEELSDVQKQWTYFSKKASGKKDEEEKKEIPLVWIFVDEGHEFLPKDHKTLSTGPLVQILREGRQPGVNLVIATQQPGKIHTDVITQSDIIISHRLTAELDIKALKEVMSTYTPGTVEKAISALPKMDGSALVMDDKTENVYPMQVRPRITWHGGGSPKALPSDYETDKKPEEF